MSLDNERIADSAAKTGESDATRQSQALEFYLRHVLPFPQADDDGRVFVAVQKQSGFTDFAAQTIDEARQIIRGVAANAHGVFVAQARMRDKRNGENALAFSSIWIDFDAKKAKQPEDDDEIAKQRVLDKINEFIAAAGLPKPSVIVDSGGGVHCYWLFEKTIEKEPWQRIAHALHACMKHHKLPADLAVTIDAARILRVPGTYNRKPEYGTPRLVSVIAPASGDPIRYDLKVIEDALANHMKSDAIEGVAPDAEAGKLKTSHWFDRLSPKIKDEVLDHALGVIAVHTKFLEHERNGGSNDIYYKLLQSCAGSDAPGAEDLWVKYTSRATDADPEQKLRADFDRRLNAGRPDGVTVGTLLKLAQEKGANFDRWKRLASRAPWLPPEQREPLCGGVYTEDEALRLINSHYFIGKDSKQIGIFRINDDGAIAFTTPDQLKLDLDNILVANGDKNKPIKGDKFWRESPYRRQCKIVFKLGGTAEPDEYNLWRGFPMQPLMGWDKQYRLLQHIREVVCRCDHAKFKYLMRWLAFLVQHPDQLPGTVIVLKSREEGTGKSTVGAVMLKIFGSHHSALVDDKDRIVGRFNDWLEPMCFILAEEILWARDHKAADKLKSRITAPQMPMERKNGAVWQAENHLHVIMTTNHDHAVAAGIGDRRNVVFDVSAEHANDKSWFGPLYRDLDDGGASEFLWLLQNLRLGDWHPRQIVKTAEATEQQRMSSDSVSQWSQACIDANEIKLDEWPEHLGQRLPKYRLSESYTKYCRNHRLHPLDHVSLGKALTQMFGARQRCGATVGPKGQPIARPWGYDVPDDATWQTKLNERLGIK